MRSGGCVSGVRSIAVECPFLIEMLISLACSLLSFARCESPNSKSLALFAICFQAGSSGGAGSSYAISAFRKIEPFELSSYFFDIELVEVGRKAGQYRGETFRRKHVG